MELKFKILRGINHTIKKIPFLKFGFSDTWLSKWSIKQSIGGNDCSSHTKTP